jgi:hypothetical protein
MFRKRPSPALQLTVHLEYLAQLALKFVVTDWDEVKAGQDVIQDLVEFHSLDEGRDLARGTPARAG